MRESRRRRARAACRLRTFTSLAPTTFARTTLIPYTFTRTDVSETIQGKSAESKKEANSESCRQLPHLHLLLTEPLACPLAEEVAKGNTNASIGDRLSAGVDAIGNKADESKQCVPLPSYFLAWLAAYSFASFYSDAKASGFKESAKN